MEECKALQLKSCEINVYHSIRILLSDRATPYRNGVVTAAFGSPHHLFGPTRHSIPVSADTT